MHFDGQSIDFYPQLIEKEMALVETYDSNYIKTFRGSSSDVRKQTKLSQLGTMYSPSPKIDTPKIDTFLKF